MPRLQIGNLPMRTDLRPRLGFFASSGNDSDTSGVLSLAIAEHGRALFNLLTPTLFNIQRQG
jgi:hypothetical protein